MNSENFFSDLMSLLSFSRKREDPRKKIAKNTKVFSSLYYNIETLVTLINNYSFVYDHCA